MHQLAVFSLRNRALIALVTVVVAVFGGLAMTSLKQELIPSVSFPQLVVVTSYPGASPEVVNTDVSTPIEAAIQGVAGLESTSATSSSNLSMVRASFTYGTDLVATEQKVQLAINRIGGLLPDDVDPRVITGSIDDFPVIQLAVTSDLDPHELSALLRDSTVPELQKLEGVREASVSGDVGSRVTITPDASALAAAGLSQQSIQSALDANGLLLPAGSITEDDSTLVVQAGARLHTAEELAALPLVGSTLTIGDVAEVAVIDNPVTSISRVNGEPALTLGVTKTPDGNTVAVSHEVREALPELAAALGSGTVFTIVFDQAPYIEQSIEALATEGLLGLVFAVIVILVFLLSIRSTLVTAISIPVSVLIAFVGMQASGYTLNIITLGALTIAIGRVVDDSIVVIENIKRHLGLGEAKGEAILTAVKEVAAAITASTVTTVAVFLPLALVGDITGELFRPFALTVTIALGASLFVALTIVPVLAYWFLPRKPAKHAGGTSAEDELASAGPLQRGYLPVIGFTLKRPIVTLLAALLVLGGTVALIPSMKTNFIGDSGQNTFTLLQTMPHGTSLDAQDAAADRVETMLREVEGIDTVQLSIGGSGLAAAFGGGGSITFSITTHPDADQDAIKEQVRERVETLTGVGEVSVASAGSAFSSSDIALNITASTQADLAVAAADVLDAVKDLEVTAEATSNLAETQPFISIVVDRDDAAAVGLSELAVGGQVSAAMQPRPVGTIVIDERTLSIYFITEDAPATLEELRDWPILTAVGPLALSELATVQVEDGPASITAIRGLRAATVTVTPNLDDVGTASATVAEAIDALDLPAGTTVELGGVTAQQADAFQQLGIALLVAILIVYVVMVAMFRSLRQPLLLLVSVPFAATGGVILQVVTGVPLGVPSLIGVLMLIGIVVTNAIVLVDLVNQYRDRGMAVRDAIVHGAARRLRPILMTALATIFALLPMALGITGHGGFISQPLAIVVIGGLISSTVLTLIVLPVLYWLVEGARERRTERRAAKVSPPVDQTATPPVE